MKRQILRWALTAALALSITVAHGFEAGRMRIHCINVGQGSATLLEFKCGAVLIDSGADSEEKVQHLVNYLDWFFNLRPDLNKTLKMMALTHIHIDHAMGLKTVATRFNVERFVFNGDDSGSGKYALRDLLKEISEGRIQTAVRIVDDARVTGQGTGAGYTDSDVDPCACDDCDPQIHILMSSLSTNPGWPKKKWESQNNHSLIIRADLGASSMLVTGDAEEEQLEYLMHRYTDLQALNTDVLVVGHHGSYNATSTDFLNMVTPKAALISCGKWNDGMGASNSYNTYSYAHPRKVTLDRLQSVISSTRPAITVKAGIEPTIFENYRVKKRIYCTAWDGSTVVDAYESGAIYVRKNWGM